MNCIVLCCCHYGVMKRNSIITSTPLIARKEKVLFEIGQMPGEGRGGGKCRLTTPQKGVAIRRRNRATPASFLRTTRHGSTVTDQAAKITTCYTTGSQRTHRCCLLASNAEHDHVNCRKVVRPSIMFSKSARFPCWLIGAPNSTSAVAPPQTPLGKLTALPQTPSCN